MRHSGVKESREIVEINGVERLFLLEDDIGPERAWRHLEKTDSASGELFGWRLASGKW